MYTMLEALDIAEPLCWNLEDKTTRTVILGMCEEFVDPITGELNPDAEKMINTTWNELDTQEQDILTKHGIISD